MEKVISGGQTGADRAALDWAIANGLLHGGWCPKGRRAEDGVIPLRYVLQETPQSHYRERTRWNVRDADATLIVTTATELTGGTLFTFQIAAQLSKPCLHVASGTQWREQMKKFMEGRTIRVLNVAGPRSSHAAGIEEFTHDVLSTLIKL